MTPKYKKFIPDEDDDCMYCGYRSYDCCCGEESAKRLGFHYEGMDAPLAPVEFPDIDSKLDKWEALAEHLRRSGINYGRRNHKIYVWRKGKQWFRNSEELVDYFNQLNISENK